MRSFPISDLQRSAAEVQKAALLDSVVLTYHEKPRYVLMSVEEYARLRGATVAAGPEAFPESALARIQAIADRYPDAPHDIAGGLADQVRKDDRVSGGRRDP